MNLSKFKLENYNKQYFLLWSQSSPFLYNSLYFQMHFSSDPPNQLVRSFISMLDRKKKREIFSFIHSTSTCSVSGPVLSAGDTELNKTWSLPSRSTRFNGGDGQESSCFSAVGKCCETRVQVQESLIEELASLRVVTIWSRDLQLETYSFSHAAYVLLYCQPFLGLLFFYMFVLILQSKGYLQGEVSDPEAPLWLW